MGMENETSDARQLERDLTHALTRYDRAQSTRKGYNHYALGIYLGRVDDVLARVAHGKSVADALRANYNDRLLRQLLDALT